MTNEQARRRLEATTRFDLRDGHVWLREVRWLCAADDLERGPSVAIPLGARCASPSLGVLAATP